MSLGFRIFNIPPVSRNDKQPSHLDARTTAWKQEVEQCRSNCREIFKLRQQCKPSPAQRMQTGFSYIEVLVALFIIGIAIVPAMEGIQTAIQGAGIHQQSSQQHYALIARMETLMADSYGNLLAAAKIATNETTASSYSDPAGQADRIIVYLSLYDADADPFSIADPNTDLDNNIYTGDTANLLWIKVELENSAFNYESLRQR